MNEDSVTVEVYQTNRRALIDYAFGITGSRPQAEDVVQEAWVRLTEATQRQEVKEPLRYIYRIVHNLSVDTLRRDRREGLDRKMDLDAATSVVADNVPSPEQVAIDRQDMKLVAEALAELPERQQTAIRMYRLGGYKLREIAEHLDVSISLVHSLIAEGMAHCDRRRLEGRTPLRSPKNDRGQK